jgi:isopenicillin-N epimerase
MFPRFNRRSALVAGASVLTGIGAVAGWRSQRSALSSRDAPRSSAAPTWNDVADLFPIEPSRIDLSAMLITSHPRPVSEAIERYRRSLDADPVVFLQENNRHLMDATRKAAADYLGVSNPEQIAVTDSTTMGISLVYHGLRLSSADEILTTRNDYYVTHESVRLAAARAGASVRHVILPHEGNPSVMEADDFVAAIMREVRPETRVLALTWVHSSTGLKLPISRITREVAVVNAERNPERRVIVCVDAVHGFGNQAESFADLGADFLMTGCHKWLFGPRGTGIIAGTEQAWASLKPTIPSFFDVAAYARWMGREPPDSGASATATAVMPGGFKAFEHLWALPEAFALHTSLGATQIADRTAELATHLKSELARMRGVRVRTPYTRLLSGGIVSFDVEGRPPAEVVAKLREKGIVASVAPYATPHVRLSPSIRNRPAHIEAAISALHGLAG